MKLNLSTIESSEMERLILVLAIGLLESQEKKVLTIKDSDNYLFSPYTVSMLEKLGMDEKVIEIIELGCELEDIKSLFPDTLSFEVKKLKNAALELLAKTDNPTDPHEVKKWVDRV